MHLFADFVARRVQKDPGFRLLSFDAEVNTSSEERSMH